MSRKVCDSEVRMLRSLKTPLLTTTPFTILLVLFYTSIFRLKEFVDSSNSKMSQGDNVDLDGSPSTSNCLTLTVVDRCDPLRSLKFLNKKCLCITVLNHYKPNKCLFSSDCSKSILFIFLCVLPGPVIIHKFSPTSRILIP